jgi:hypothetical protein
MAHRVAPEAEVEFDNIWYYVAKASGSIEAADRVIDTITELSIFSRATRILDATARGICVPACAGLSHRRAGCADSSCFPGQPGPRCLVAAVAIANTLSTKKTSPSAISFPSS